MEKIKKYWLEIIGIALSIFIIFVVRSLYILFNELYINSKTTECHEIYGYFGSYVGGVFGTILTAITLVFVYLTYRSQRKELKLQSQLIAQQQFESTFFNMLNIHRELKNGLKGQKSSKFNNNIEFEKIYKGLDYINFINATFEEYYQYLKNIDNTEYRFEFEQLKFEYNRCSQKNEDNILRVCFADDLFKTYQNQISHYCRNVYHILKYIRENEENKTLGEDYNKYKNYANIFQSQLNIDEQFLLFYNFIHFNDKENKIYSAINLVNHYQFFENIGIDNLIFKKHEEFYDFVIKGSDRKIEKK